MFRLIKGAQDYSRRRAIAAATGNLQRQTNQFVNSGGDLPQIKAFDNDDSI